MLVCTEACRQHASVARMRKVQDVRKCPRHLQPYLLQHLRKVACAEKLERPARTGGLGHAT